MAPPVSIFGDTYRGIPNPRVPIVHAYPTRFHGPVYREPEAIQSYMPAPWAKPSFMGFDGAVGSCCASCSKGGPCAGGAPTGLGACQPCVVAAAALGDPLLCKSTGSGLVDVALGALVGWFCAPEPDRMAYAVGGAIAGTVGIVGVAVVGGFGLLQRKR